MYSRKTLKKILALMSEKYPTDYSKGMNPVLFIYDDESGRIVKDATNHAYEVDNDLFHFNDIEELVEHLQS